MQACHDSQTMMQSVSGVLEDSTVKLGVEMCESFSSESGTRALVKGGNGKKLGPD